MTTEADFSVMLSEIFVECEVRGMKLPFVVCAVRPNGSVIALRVHGYDGKDPDILVEHTEGGIFQPPITIMVLDQTNEAVKITISAKGERTWH